MRLVFTVLSTLVIAVLVGAGRAAPSPASDPSAKLGIWLGRWNFSGQIFQTKYSNAHPDTGVVDCTWTANKGYVLCDYFSDNPPHDDLTATSYDPSAKAYTLVQIHKDRPPTSDPVTLNGNTWISSTDAPDKGKTLVVRTTFVFVTSDKQTTTVQVSADEGRTWTTIVRVTAVKST